MNADSLGQTDSTSSNFEHSVNSMEPTYPHNQEVRDPYMFGDFIWVGWGRRQHGS